MFVCYTSFAKRYSSILLVPSKILESVTFLIFVTKQNKGLRMPHLSQNRYTDFNEFISIERRFEFFLEIKADITVNSRNPKIVLPWRMMRSFRWVHTKSNYITSSSITQNITKLFLCKTFVLSGIKTHFPNLNEG